MTEKKTDDKVWHEANGGYIPRQEERGYEPKPSGSSFKPPQGGTGESGKKDK
jgi:hypothetical protein